MNKRLIASVAALGSVALLLAAQASYSFKVVQKVGDTFKTKVSVETTLQGMPVLQTRTAIEKVTKVDDQGLVTTESKATEVTLQVNGQDMPSQDSGTQIETRTATGEMVHIIGEGTSLSTAKRVARISALPTPAKPITIGDSWSFNYPAETDLSVPSSKVTFKLVGEEKVGKWDSLKVEFTFAEDSGDAPIKASGTIWYDKSTFIGNKADVKVDNFPMPEKAPVKTLDIKMKVDRTE